MKSKKNNELVSFSSKGQTLIRAWLRKEFKIGVGSKALVQATDEGILLRPITLHTIERLHGILKRDAGGEGLANEWADHKREERELEDAD